MIDVIVMYAVPPRIFTVDLYMGRDVMPTRNSR